MGDRETDSAWDHITGRCIYGKLEGYQLETGDLHVMRADQVLEAYPNAHLALSKLPLRYRIAAWFIAKNTRSKKGVMPPYFFPTLGEEDSRRGRMELGLGVWTENAARYYPMALLRKQLPLFDTLDGRSMIVGIDPQSKTPFALYTEATAISASNDTGWHLDKGQIVKNGLLYDSDGTQIPDAIPQNLFTRWYGFSLTFPGCDIYAPDS